MQRLQTPLLAVRDRLPRRRDVRLGEEQPAEPHLDVVQVAEARDVRQLREPARKVGHPFGHAHRFVHLVAAPVVRDRAYPNCLVYVRLVLHEENTPLISELMSVRRWFVCFSSP